MLFHITKEGRALYEQVRPRATEISRQFQALYTPEEYGLLMSLIERATIHADAVLEGREVEEDEDDELD